MPDPIGSKIRSVAAEQGKNIEPPKKESPIINIEEGENGEWLQLMRKSRKKNSE